MSNELVVQNGLDEIELTQKMCNQLMKTKHYAKMGEEGIFAILCKAKSMGLNPIDALNGQFYMVQGKLGMSAEMMANLIRKAGHSISKDSKSTDTCCILNGKRKDNGDTWQMKFSIEDAKRAGIYKNMWEKYPQAMLYNRCLSFLARQLFPDVIQGVSYTKEELDEISDSKTSYSNKSNFDPNQLAPTVFEEVKVETISQQQAEEFKKILNDCSDEYKKEVTASVKEITGIEKPKWADIPLSCYEKLHKAAVENRMLYQGKLAKQDIENLEVVDE